ncbi:MAG: YceI family protein [Xanthomonadaceae bacterium]|nr:YceI family protein [Xanthomonadaceae bacterium]MDE2055333.1 polyisoprenoid-binding protein [Xanthomonadaceae bacterium]MDE2496249.1 polyisoprenoid-binding protein [Xanthomonadaceae bacterium]
MRFLLLALLIATGAAAAKPVHYTIDPDHTHPSFAADHMGLSTWRGKFDHSSGAITLDRAKQTGSVHIMTQVDSINFGNPPLTQMVLRDAIPAPLCKTQCAFFDAAKYPTAVYDGTLADFVDDAPTRVVGKLTLHGVTRPVDLKIEHFKCIPDFVVKPRERCGAEASATFDRADFGINAGQSFGMDMKVSMQIQVEAVQDK